MPLLVAEAARLTLPDLKTEILETQIIRGAPMLFARVPFRNDDAETMRLLWEDNSSVSTSLADPCLDTELQGTSTCSTASDSRDSLIQDITWKHMRRHADVCVLHTFDNRHFDRKRVEMRKQAKYLVEDWANQLFNGKGNGLNYHGIEFYLDYMVDTLGLVGLKRYHTDDGTATGVAQALSLPAITEAMMQVRCGTYSAIISDLSSFINFRALIEVAGGNTAPMLMAENFGVSVFSHGQYNGVPWIVYDRVGASKTTSASVGITSGDQTVTVDVSASTGDPGWEGFGDLDVGREITIPGAGVAAGDLVTTIQSVTDANTVEVDDAASTTVAASSGSLTVTATNVIYMVNFDEDDGFHYRYPEQNGSFPATVGKCLPSVGGMTEINIGLLQNCEIDRVRLRTYGNFANEGADSIVRLSHYSLPY